MHGGIKNERGAESQDISRKKRWKQIEVARSLLYFFATEVDTVTS
jgi:hypothetical protein